MSYKPSAYPLGEPMPLPELDPQLKQQLEKVAHLTKRMRDADVKALYIGDSNHYNSGLAFQYSLATALFTPDLLFREVGAEQKHIDLDSMMKRGIINNGFYEAMFAKACGATMIGVDEPEVGKKRPFTQERSEERTSLKTHQRIAGRIADHVKEFYDRHGRMPVFAVIFGSAHFENRRDLDEVVNEQLAIRGLKAPKSRSIEFVKAPSRETTVHFNIFKEYDYTVEVDPKVPLNLPDVRNPKNLVHGARK